MAGLGEYERKRDFGKTAEPAPRKKASAVDEVAATPPADKLVAAAFALAVAPAPAKAG